MGNMFIEYATTLDYMKMKSTTERKGSEHSSLKCRVFKEAVENHERERARERGKVRGKEIERENKREENDRQMVSVYSLSQYLNNFVERFGQRHFLFELRT